MVFLFFSFLWMVLATVAVCREWERRTVIFLAWALFFALCGIVEGGFEAAQSVG
jgi:hypothetical protein